MHEVIIFGVYGMCVFARIRHRVSSALRQHSSGTYLFLLPSFVNRSHMSFAYDVSCGCNGWTNQKRTGTTGRKNMWCVLRQRVRRVDWSHQRQRKGGEHFWQNSQIIRRWGCKIWVLGFTGQQSTHTHTHSVSSSEWGHSQLVGTDAVWIITKGIGWTVKKKEKPHNCASLWTKNDSPLTIQCLSIKSSHFPHCLTSHIRCVLANGILVWDNAWKADAQHHMDKVYLKLTTGFIGTL